MLCLSPVLWAHTGGVTYSDVLVSGRSVDYHLVGEALATDPHLVALTHRLGGDK